MPFGVVNTPAVFQRLIQKVLSRMMAEAEEFLAVYLDDVIDLEHLEKVFNCLEDANLKLNHKMMLVR